MKIGIFTKQWPRHNFNGHLQKTINLIQSLINLNHDLVICSDDPETKNKEQIKQFPLQTLQINPKKISTSLSGFTGLKFKPNVFIFDSFQTEDKYSAFVYNRWNKCSRILAVNELGGLSKWRKNNYKLIPNVLVPNGALMSPEKCQQIFTLQQLRSIHRSDYIFTGNDYLYHLIGKHLYPNVKNKTKYVSHVSHAYPLDQYYDQTLNLKYRPFKNRKNFIFLGNMQNQSNRDCIFLLASAIWPQIRAKLPEAQLHIYGQAGSYYQNLFKNSSSNENLSKSKLKNLGFYFKGVLPKEQQFLAEYKTLLYPCTFTTGPHIKILQSWFMHLPAVTTPVGAQGLFYQSYDPQFSSNTQGHSNLQFSSERVYTKQQNQQAQKIKTYYDNNIISSKSVKNFTYGGSYENFTYKDFIQSAVKIYTDEQYWNICLKNAHKIIKKKNNDMHLQVVLKKALVNVQIASYQGRSRPSYEQQWKRYTKSQQFNKKIRS